MLSLIPASAGLALLAPHGLVHYFKSHFGCKYDTFVSLESSAAGVVND